VQPFAVQHVQQTCIAGGNHYVAACYLYGRGIDTANFKGQDLLMSLMTFLRAGLLGVTLCTALISTEASAQRSDGYLGAFKRQPNPYSQAGPKAVTQPGNFDYYVMALSWSPSYCASLPRDGYDPQCNPRSGRKYSFVLHGVWPQFTKGWPQDCPTADKGFVPASVADRMLDIMPSKKLVFHEYRKHGTCSGLGIDGYFAFSRKAYEGVKIPDRLQNVTDARMFMSTGEMIKEFTAANPTLKPDMIAIECGGPGNRLKEVRICMDKAGNYQACGRNENQKKMCSADRMYIPPVRDSAAPSNNTPQRLSPALPGERKI
jgi:ribonuclease T2